MPQRWRTSELITLKGLDQIVASLAKPSCGIVQRVEFPSLVGPESYTISGTLLERIQSYEHTIRYESEYFLQMRKIHNKILKP